jgi:hypothetical protein
MTIPKLKFDPTITWGYIFNTILVLMAAAYGVSELRASDRDLTRAIELAETRADARITLNTVRIENQGALIADKLENIKEAIDELKRAIRPSSLPSR